MVYVRVRWIIETLKTPSIHGRLGSSTLSQLAFLRHSNSNFPWEKSHWDITVVKSKVKKKCPHSRWTGDGGAPWSIKKCLVVSSVRSHDLSDAFSWWVLFYTFSGGSPRGSDIPVTFPTAWWNSRFPASCALCLAAVSKFLPDSTGQTTTNRSEVNL